MEILFEFIPVEALDALVVAFLEPVETWRHTRSEKERLAILNVAEIGVLLGPPCENSDPEDGKRPVLNSRAALFGRQHVVFVARRDNWMCRADSTQTQWAGKFPKLSGFWHPFHPHRDGNQPAVIKLEDDGTVSLRWCFAVASSQSLHRALGEPAVVTRSVVQWYCGGQLHRGHGKPADIDLATGAMGWFRDGKRYSLPANSPMVHIPTQEELEQLRQMAKEQTSLSRWQN